MYIPRPASRRQATRVEAGSSVAIMAFVYILKSEIADKTYTGSTTDIERRISEHNNGKTTFSKRYRPWKLIYVEKYESLPDARKREKYLKSAAGRSFINKKNIIPR